MISDNLAYLIIIINLFLWGLGVYFFLKHYLHMDVLKITIINGHNTDYHKSELFAEFHCSGMVLHGLDFET